MFVLKNICAERIAMYSIENFRAFNLAVRKLYIIIYIYIYIYILVKALPRVQYGKNSTRARSRG